MTRSFAAMLTVLIAATNLCAAAVHAAEPVERGASGLPLPRFVSLGSSKVNVRGGPSRDHKIKWTFVKAGLPVEIVREFGNWRRVRDAAGEEGWVHGSLLSGRRTALVAPWSQDEMVALREAADRSAGTKAYLEPYVLAEVERCDGAWCAITGRGWRGMVPQGTLWGVYPREVVD